MRLISNMCHHIVANIIQIIDINSHKTVIFQVKEIVKFVILPHQIGAR